jgi:hypothetical protein
MKKTLLACLLVGAASVAFGQRSVGTARMMEPLTTDGLRATDTVYSAVFDDEFTELAVYGVTDDGGYILGTNTYGDKAKVQSFLLDAPTIIEEMLFWFGEKSNVSGSTLQCRIYAMDGPGVTLSDPNYQYAPGTVLADVAVNIADVDTGTMQTLTVVPLDSPIWTGIEFAAGVDFSSLAVDDSVALVSSLDGIVEIGEQCWEKWSDDDWYTLPAAGWGGGTFDVDAFILVVIDNTTIGIDEAGSMNNMRMSFMNGNISNGSVVLAYDVVESGSMALMVMDSKGQIVHDQTFGNQAAGRYNHTFSTEGWAAGQYYVTLKNNGQPLTKKMVVR